MTGSAQATPVRQGVSGWFQPERRPAGVSRRSLVAVLGFIVAAVLALVGQRQIAVGEYPADGVALLVAGGVLLLIVLLRQSGPLAESLLTQAVDRQDSPTDGSAATASAEGERGRPWLRRPLLAILILSAFVAFVQAGGGLFRPLGVGAWLLAVGSFLLGNDMAAVKHTVKDIGKVFKGPKWAPTNIGPSWSFLPYFPCLLPSSFHQSSIHPSLHQDDAKSP